MNYINVIKKNYMTLLKSTIKLIFIVPLRDMSEINELIKIYVPWTSNV